jgi:ribonuclease D
MLRYGRFDVHYLLALRKLMIRDLTQGDLWDDVGAKPAKSSIKAEAALIAKTLKTLMQRSGKEYAEDSDDVKSVATSQGSTEDGYFTPEEDDVDDSQKRSSGDTVVKKLRMNANLMSVLSNSQQRCLSFWKNKKEHVKLRHGSFFTVCNESAQNDVKWSEHHSRICEALVEWRQSIAKNEGTMPGLVFSSEFLMAIARKRPSSHDELRRLSFFLPELLQDEQSTYIKQLFNLIQSFHDRKENFVASDSDTKYYQTTTHIEVEVIAEEKADCEETKYDRTTSLIDQTEHVKAREGHHNDKDGVIKYCITFVAFMAIGASVTAIALRRYR